MGSDTPQSEKYWIRLLTAYLAQDPQPPGRVEVILGEGVHLLCYTQDDTLLHLWLRPAEATTEAFHRTPVTLLGQGEGSLEGERGTRWVRAVVKGLHRTEREAGWVNFLARAERYPTQEQLSGTPPSEEPTTRGVIAPARWRPRAALKPFHRYVDQILIISLTQTRSRDADAISRQRRQVLAHQMSSLGYVHAFVPAVDGSTVDLGRLMGDGVVHPDVRLKDVSPRPRGALDGTIQLSAGELGCALSHRTVYETMLHQDLEHCLILEDDAFLTPAFDQTARCVFAEIVALSEGAWDFVSLFSQRNFFCEEGGRGDHQALLEAQERSRRVTLVDGVLRGAPLSLSSTTKIGSRLSPCWTDGVTIQTAHREYQGTVAYAISRRGARALLALATPIRDTSEGPLRDLTDPLRSGGQSTPFNCFAVFPNLLATQDDRSLIDLDAQRDG